MTVTSWSDFTMFLKNWNGSFSINTKETILLKDIFIINQNEFKFTEQNIQNEQYFLQKLNHIIKKYSK